MWWEIWKSYCRKMTINWSFIINLRRDKILPAVSECKQYAFVCLQLHFKGISSRRSLDRPRRIPLCRSTFVGMSPEDVLRSKISTFLLKWFLTKSTLKYSHFFKRQFVNAATSQLGEIEREDTRELIKAFTLLHTISLSCHVMISLIISELIIK